MATNTLFSTIILRNDTAATWQAVNPTLAAAEIGIENDTGRFKIGDGTLPWNQLRYSAADADNKTITTNADGALTLRNWGTRYYRWVAATETAEGHYELTQVDDTHPWLAGLTPRSAGNGEIEWYEPSDVTVEEVNTGLAAVQSTVENLQTTIGEPTDTAEAATIYGKLNSKLGTEGGTLTGPLTLADGSEAASQTYVANQVASAGHLKREVVEALPEAAAADPNTIYMVKIADAPGGDKYQEFMLIGGELVQIGDTTVDLSSYATQAALTEHVDNTTVHITEAERTAWNTVKEAVDAMPAIKGLGDGLALDESGNLALDRVNIQKVFVETGDTLILNGGGAE